MDKRYPKWAILILGIAFLLSACTGVTKVVSTGQVACDKIASAITQAQKDVASADQKVKSSKGTPDEVTAQKVDDAAHQDLQSLQAQQGKCNTATAQHPVLLSAPESATQTVMDLLTNAGFTTGQFTVGENFNLSLPAALSAAQGKFAANPLTTKAALVAFLGSSDPAAQKVLAQVTQNAGVTQQDALDPNNWTGFQLLIASDWTGNTSFISNKVTSAGTRHSQAGDIGWVLLNPSDLASGMTIATGLRYAIVRMACGNPQTVVPTPPGKLPPAVCQSGCNNTPCVTGCTPTHHVCPCTTKQQVMIPVQGSSPAPSPRPAPTPAVPGPTPMPGSPAPSQTPPGYVGSPPGGSTCPLGSTNCQTTANPTPSASPTVLDTGTHPSPAPSPTAACGPLSVPYKAC